MNRGVIILSLKAKKVQGLSGVRNMTNEAREIRIPVLQGHVAAKDWGDPDGIPILGLHGWLDNAGTYDNLVPLLPKNYRLISLDLLGHGLTSHIPQGALYNPTDPHQILRSVLEFFKLEKAVLMGHSMGGGIATRHAAVFPEQVEKLISIDLISHSSTPPEKQPKFLRKAVVEGYKIHKKVEDHHTIPTYSYEEACERAFQATNSINGEGSITMESVQVLMKRGLKEVEEGKVTWTADLRLRVPFIQMQSHQVAEAYCSQVKCPHLLIKAFGSNKFMSDENYDSILEVYRNSNPNFVYKEAEGGHHLHLNRPDVVAPLINEFLDQSFE